MTGIESTGQGKSELQPQQGPKESAGDALLSLVTDALKGSRTGKKKANEGPTGSEATSDAAMTEQARAILKDLRAPGIPLDSSKMKLPDANRPHLPAAGKIMKPETAPSNMQKWFAPSYMALMLGMMMVLAKVMQHVKMQSGMNKAELITKSMEVVIETANLAKELKYLESEKMVTDAIMYGAQAGIAAGSIAFTMGTTAAAKAKSAGSKGISKAKAAGKHAYNRNHNAKKYEKARQKVDTLENNDPRASVDHAGHKKWQKEHKTATAQMKRYEPGFKQAGKAKANATAKMKDNDGYDADAHADSKIKQQDYNKDKAAVKGNPDGAELSNGDVATKGKPGKEGTYKTAAKEDVPAKEQNAGEIREERNDKATDAAQTKGEIDQKKADIGNTKEKIEKKTATEAEVKQMEQDEKDLGDLEKKYKAETQEVNEADRKLALIGDENDEATYENKLNEEIAGTEPGLNQLADYKNSGAYTRYKADRKAQGISEEATDKELAEFEGDKKQKLAKAEKHYDELKARKEGDFKNDINEAKAKARQDYQESLQQSQQLGYALFGQGGQGGVLGNLVGMWNKLENAKLTEQEGTLQSMKISAEGRLQIMRDLVQSYGEDFRNASDFISKLIDGWAREASAHNQAFGFQLPR